MHIKLYIKYISLNVCNVKIIDISIFEKKKVSKFSNKYVSLENLKGNTMELNYILHSRERTFIQYFNTVVTLVAIFILKFIMNLIFPMK